MSDTYEINDRNEVIPYTSGRRCNDTRAWRDATDLELQQRGEIAQLERELAEARAALKTGGLLDIIDRAGHERAHAIRERDEARKQCDRLAEALRKIRAGYGGQSTAPDCCEDCDFLIPIDEALATLNQPEP